ncbi:MAG: glycerol-3-phosphate acyltransferase PlsY [Rhodospirillaceae bacterium]|nr:MAG: glycerol-3-phosphate acyltransferase PlsY [Rhodospirillaceae bacterium]
MNVGVIHFLAAAGGYGLGAIPFGLVLTWLAGMGDIRAIGSGNIGATNVLRTGHKGLALATLLLDSGKGAAAAWLAPLVFPDHAHAVALAAGSFAVVGHNFPFWLRFKGGKGVATTLGMLLATVWPVGLLSCLTWVGVAAIFRYSSLAALLALALAPVYAFVFADRAAMGVFAGLALVGWFRHKANIHRLLTGVESRLGAKG